MLTAIITLWLQLFTQITENGPVSSSSAEDWGFFGHQRINRLAVFTLPVEMIDFYKYHIDYIESKAVNPDMRRYIDPREAPRHYIDLDVYGDSAWYKLPRYWNDAVAQYTEDTLQAYGIVPWHVYTMKNFLTKAFRDQNLQPRQGAGRQEHPEEA